MPPYKGPKRSDLRILGAGLRGAGRLAVKSAKWGGKQVKDLAKFTSRSMTKTETLTPDNLELQSKRYQRLAVTSSDYNAGLADNVTQARKALRRAENDLARANAPGADAVHERALFGNPKDPSGKVPLRESFGNVGVETERAIRVQGGEDIKGAAGAKYSDAPRALSGTRESRALMEAGESFVSPGGRVGRIDPSVPRGQTPLPRIMRPERRFPIRLWDTPADAHKRINARGGLMNKLDLIQESGPKRLGAWGEVKRIAKPFVQAAKDVRHAPNRGFNATRRALKSTGKGFVVGLRDRGMYGFLTRAGRAGRDTKIIEGLAARPEAGKSIRGPSALTALEHHGISDANRYSALGEIRGGQLQHSGKGGVVVTPTDVKATDAPKGKLARVDRLGGGLIRGAARGLPILAGAADLTAVAKDIEDRDWLAAGLHTGDAIIDTFAGLYSAGAAYGIERQTGQRNRGLVSGLASKLGVSEEHTWTDSAVTDIMEGRESDEEAQLRWEQEAQEEVDRRREAKKADKAAMDARNDEIFGEGDYVYASGKTAMDARNDEIFGEGDYVYAGG